MKKEIYEALEKIKNEINNEYGFVENTPRINYGPCGVFAYLFYNEWKAMFDDEIHICFIMTKDMSECYHVCISLPNGELYDGGIGIHKRYDYADFNIVDMLEYDYSLLDKWSYGLDRTYPRYCPEFDRNRVQKIIHDNLSCIVNDNKSDELILTEPSMEL